MYKRLWTAAAAVKILLVITLLAATGTSACVPRAVLTDDFDDNDLSDWQNRPIVEDVIDHSHKSEHPMPGVIEGRIHGVGSGYNFVRPWMIREVDFKSAQRLSIQFRGKTGESPINQAGVWLVATSWEGDFAGTDGYHCLLSGEGSRRILVYRYDRGKATVIAQFAVGKEVYSPHNYCVMRDASGNWSATMDKKLLPRGEKDRLTRNATFHDMTYTNFRFVGVHLTSEESEFDCIRIGREPDPTFGVQQEDVQD